MDNSIHILEWKLSVCFHGDFIDSLLFHVKTCQAFNLVCQRNLKDFVIVSNWMAQYELVSLKAVAVNRF